MDMFDEKESNEHDNQWERDLINRLSFASLAEQRRARRWGIFFKFLLFGYLFVLLYIAVQSPGLSDSSLKLTDHTAVVNVDGLISDATDANAETIIEGIQDAYDDVHTKGIILRINSPGGSPVQSDYIYKEIMRLKEQHSGVPLYAVIVDVGASGAYYIASAADSIYVNPSSIVGSIGVRMDGFGFTQAMEKLGVERRLLTAGNNKGALDPFLPIKEEEVQHVKGLLNEIHHEFINAVKKGRGDRLDEQSHPELFSGLFWAGRQSIELGLADDIGDVGYVAREVVKVDNIVDFTPQPDFFKRFADQIGATMANILLETSGSGAFNLR